MLAHTTTVPLEASTGGTPQPISGEVLSSRRLADLGPGARVGDYVIDGWLARGGFGDVYRATHATLGAARAVKVLHADLAATRAAVLRFEREIETVRRVEHPGVVRVESYGQLDDGRPWFAMDLLRGQDLADRIHTRGRLSPAEALAILEPLAAALDAVHAAGIIHRDLKPSNVFLDERPDVPAAPPAPAATAAPPGTAAPPAGLRVVLLDFGVVKLLDDTGPGLTASLQVIGTPAYMAPEQIRGQPAGVHSDIYALGAIVFAMLAGEPPFGASHDAVGLLQLHLHTRPPRVSSRAPVDPAFDDVVQRALSKHPEQRHASAGALLDDLRRAFAIATPRAARVPAAPAAPPSPAAQEAISTDGPTESQHPPPQAVAVYVAVRPDDASIDDPDEALLASLDALLPRASAALAGLGLRPALEMGDAVLYLLDLPPDAAAARAARADLLAAALALHDDLAARSGAGGRIEVTLCLHAGLPEPSAAPLPPMLEHTESTLLDVAAWVPDPPVPGVHASPGMLAGTPYAAGPPSSDLLHAVRRPPSR